MRFVSEQYLSKGARVLYHVALRERDDGRFELLCRWDNPKNVDAKTSLCRSEDTGRALFAQKVEELCGRGYDRCARPVPMRQPEAQAPAPAAPPAAAPSVMSHALSPPRRDEESLDALLSKRRREAAWSLD